MNPTQRALIMQRWSVVQHELIPELRNDVTLTPRLEKLIHTLEWIRIEEFVQASWCGIGRPPHERSWLANAFVAGDGHYDWTDRAISLGSRTTADLWFPSL